MGVCVLGSINRDIVARVDHLPTPGETVAAAGVMLLAGGKGANQAVAAARMGTATRIIGAVGEDADGTALTRYLAGEGVAIDAVARHSSQPTGTAYIMLDSHGENQIVVNAGANASVGAAAAAAIRPDDRVFLAQLETAIEGVAAFFAAAGRSGGPRILNAAPALAEGAALFAAADLLIFNQTELARYLDLPAEPQAVEDVAVARRLFTRPGQTAVVTLGARGVVMIEADALLHVPGRRVAVVDTTGAGDCFCGVLASGIAEGLLMARALLLANLAASLCVGRIGAGPAMPTRAEVEALAATI